MIRTTIVLLSAFLAFCTGKPGHTELRQAAKTGVALLDDFARDYALIQASTGCTAILKKYTERWQNEVLPLHKKALEKNQGKSELVVHREFAADYPEDADAFRQRFKQVHELGKLKASLCKSDPEYSKVQESAWRVFLGLAPKK